MENPGYNPTPGGDAQFVQPQALGEPGNRRFRIVVVANGLTWILWLEKQQVQALGLAIEQTLDHVPGQASWPDWVMQDVPFDESTDLQFRVGRIEMGVDVVEGRVVIAAHDMMQGDEDAEPSARFRMSMEMARAFSEQAAELMIQGRPLCPMCGMPQDTDHTCPEQNGHLPLDIDDPFIDLG